MKTKKQNKKIDKKIVKINKLEKKRLKDESKLIDQKCTEN